MKIVMLCDFYNESLHYQENLLSKYYTKHNHQVTVIASTFTSAFDYISDKYDSKKPGSTYMTEGVKIIRLPYSFNLFNRLRRFPGIDKILLAEQPDLIFIHDIHLNLHEAANYKKSVKSCKIVMDYHADYSNSAKNWVSLNILHKIIRKSILYLDIKSIDKIYSIVPAGITFLHEVYGIACDQIELLPLGSDTDLAHSIMNAQKGKSIRKSLGISANDFVIFTGGKLTPAKKTHLLIEACQQINNNRVHLFIIGDASEADLDYKEQLLRLASKNSRIHFLGWIGSNDVYDYMDASDLAIFPASQSVLWQQSISMGLPLIVGKVGSQDASYLNLYGNVITIDEMDITADRLIFHIMGLLNNKTILDELKAGALLTSEELLSYDKIVLRTLENMTSQA